MKKINNVIFDFDGVIADSHAYHFNRMVELARDNLGVTQDEKKVISEIRSKSYMELMKTFKISWTKLPLIYMMIRHAQEDMYNSIEKIKIFPGMKKVLLNLKNQGYNIAILSSNIEKSVRAFIEINGIDVFNDIYCGTNILGKTAAIDSLLKKNGWDMDKSVYLGDEIRDVEACRKLGIKIIGVSWGLQRPSALKKFGADYIAKTPPDIMKIVSS